MPRVLKIRIKTNQTDCFLCAAIQSATPFQGTVQIATKAKAHGYLIKNSIILIAQRITRFDLIVKVKSEQANLLQICKYTNNLIVDL